MKLQVPQYIRTLNPYVPGKPIEETQRELGIDRVIKLASNENPLGPSPKALEAVLRASRELHRYPDASAYHLKKKLAAHLTAQHESASLGTESILVGNGSNEVIDMLIRTFCVPGDCIVTSKAAFIAYRICAQIQGVETIEAPLTEDLRFDLDAMARFVRDYEKAKLVFIANPNNPTGTYLGADELRSFLTEISKIRDGSVLVALDYAYWEYVTDEKIPDPMELQREFPNVVVLRTFSKVYGLAGLRAGYGVADPEIISTVERVRQPFNLNSLALVGAEAALDDQEFVARSKRLNTEGLKFWEEKLREMEVPYWKSQGNFVLADVERGLGRRGGDVYLACLKKGVIFRPVANYGLMNALRISVGTPEENEIAAKVLASELPQRRSS